MLKPLYKIDDQTECLISGYIRNLHNSLTKDDNSLFQIVPPLVSVTITSFYNVTERFDIAGIYTIKLDQDKTIKKTQGYVSLCSQLKNHFINDNKYE